jgi:uncharacterized protein (TIGR02145 family)
MKLLPILLLFLLGCPKPEPEDCAGVAGGNAVEDIDGNCYSTVQIGDQLWMAENLKVTHYNNGSEIPTGYSNFEWAELEIGAYSVYPADSSTTCGDDCVDVYGNLYNWSAVNDSHGLCMDGWHVPSDGEWTDLITYLDVDADPDANWLFPGFGTQSYIAGGKMKEAGLEHWNYYSDEITEEATNESGFTALPAGYRNNFNGYDGSMGDYGYFWASYGYDRARVDAFTWRLGYNSSNVYRSNSYGRGGYSIRCLGD